MFFKSRKLHQNILSKNFKREKVKTYSSRIHRLTGTQVLFNFPEYLHKDPD